MTLTPADILAHPDVVELLGWPFDFEIDSDIERDADFTIAGAPRFEAIAGDGTGNTFVLVGPPGDPTRPMLYVDHECRAGVIGASLQEGMQIIVALPYWRDLLKFSGGGDLDEMKRASAILEEECREEVAEWGEGADLDAARARILSALQLSPLQDPVATLHSNVLEFQGRFEATFIEGDTCGSLFGPSRYRVGPGYRLDGGDVDPEP